jgi:hypothetical protein
MRGKSPSIWCVVVIAGAGAVLASAVTPAVAAQPSGKTNVAKKHASDTARAPRAAPAGGTARISLEWAITSGLRP